jgi:DNA-binding transcriptional ArsR family regulator
MEAALRAIAEPRRRAILRLVRDAELTAGAIASHFDVSRPAISQHLGVLKDAGLVSERRDGTRRLYRARLEGLAELRDFLEGFWDGRLHLLKQAAEREEHERRTDQRDDKPK